MKKILVVLLKELRDNIRDRRSVFFALLYGPVLLPMMMIGPIALGVKKYSVDYEELLTVQMTAPDQATNFVGFLLEKNIKVVAAQENYIDAVREQNLDLVIELAPEFKQTFREGKTAAIRVYFNRKNDGSERAFRKVSAAIHEYRQNLALTRLAVRGIDTDLLRPIHLQEEDLGEIDVGAKTIATMVPFIIILSLTMGGFYLAIDSTAGERERHSLEPLLSLSISRLALVFAKWLVLVVFVAASGALATLSTYLVFSFIPVEELRQILRVDLFLFALVFLLCAPLIPFFTTAMMLIASFARNMKEAQTHLGLSMMLPMLPFFIIQFINLQGQSELMWVPVLSQFLIIEQLLSGEHVALQSMLKSSATSLACALVLFLCILRLYRQENILGSQ